MKYGDMPKELRKVWFYTCCRCQHEWQGRTEDHPKVCAKCKSPYWDTPRRSELAKANKSRA